MDFIGSFGLWVRQRRKLLDLTQEELARQVGCSVSAIRKIEADLRRPSRQIAGLLAEHLQVQPEDRDLFLKIARSKASIDHLSALSPMVAGFEAIPAAAPMVEPPAAQLPIESKWNIPQPSSPLVGRENELREIEWLLRDRQCRLLTLVGPGGIGKTRLAIEAALKLTSDPSAEGLEDAFFVSMAPISSSEYVPAAIGAAIGLNFYSAGNPKIQLLNYLKEKKALLVLDNLEHLLSAGPGEERQIEFLTQLLQSAPGIKVLATSRERVNLQGEWVFEIHGLPVPPLDELHAIEDYSAAALFIKNASRINPDFRLSDTNRPHIIRICHQVDGIPLGIELAASWIRVLSSQEIANEIERSMDFLTSSMRDLPERHRSMRAVFDHSWDLLSPEERQVLMSLSSFRGGFSREAAEQVAGAQLLQLRDLMDKSLVQRASTYHPTAGERRYDLLEPVRQYAYEKLLESGELGAVNDRHLRYYSQLVEQAEPELLGPQQVAWLDILEYEHNNIRSALEWSQNQPDRTQVGLQMAAGLWRFWSVRGHAQEGKLWLEKTLQNTKTPQGEATVKALNGVGLLAWRLGEYEDARELTEQCAELSRHLGDRRGRAYALALLGLIISAQGEMKRAEALTEESASIFRDYQDRYGLALSLNSLGELARMQNDQARAEALYLESLALYRQQGYKRGVADLLHNLGYVAYHQGDFKTAVARFRESLNLELEQRNQRGIAECLLGLAAVIAAQGDLIRAVRLFAAGDALLRKAGAALEPIDRLEFENSLASTLQRLSPEELSEAEAAGGSLTVEQAVRSALEEI